METLPNEIIYSIIDKLPSEEIPNLFLVCKCWKDISTDIYLKRLSEESSESAEEKLIAYAVQQSYKLHLDEEQKIIQRNHFLYEIASCRKCKHNDFDVNDLREQFDEFMEIA
jgi:hypothetical protein